MLNFFILVAVLYKILFRGQVTAPFIYTLHRACLGFLQQSKGMWIRLGGYSKLPVGDKVSVNVCLPLSVSPAMSRVYPALPSLKPFLVKKCKQIADSPNLNLSLLCSKEPNFIF